MITIFLLALWPFQHKEAVKPEDVKAKELTEAQKLDFFKIKAEFATAQVDQIAAQRIFDEAQKRIETSRTAYAEWIKMVCEGEEPKLDAKGYPVCGTPKKAK